jgi:hypothetical protein
MAVRAVSAPSHISLSANSGREGRLGFRSRWMFSTLDNRRDPTFNQLLGINNRGEIAGYFGSGAKGHPNKGYLLLLGRRSRYVSENFPGSVQTQVTGLNDTGVTVGFWSGQNTASQTNDNIGFFTWHGLFSSVAFPTRNNATPPVNQLLGVNDSDVAVGFYTDAKGNAHGYTFSILRHRFRAVTIHGAPSLTAAAINNEGAIAGFYTGPGGVTRAFVRGPGGRVTRLTFPGASATQAFGINDAGEVAGTYMTGSGSSAKSFGFTWTRQRGFRTVTDPLGMGTTTINGINDAGDLVGFYTDAAGNTDGLLFAPFRAGAPAPAPMMTTPMPTMTPRPTMTAMPPSMTPAPTMTPTPTMTVPTMMPTAPPTMTPTPTAPPQPVSSASPPGGPW